MLDAVWSGARGWLTPPVLFLFINLVIGTIAVMSKLVSATAPAGGGDRRSLMRAPSVAFDRLRCFSFSRLGLPTDDHAAAAAYPAFDDDGGATETAAFRVHPAQDGGEWRRTGLLRAPSVALDRLRGFSFSRRGEPADHALATDAEASPLRSAPAVATVERKEAKEPTSIERSQSEAAAEAEAEVPARRRQRARKTRTSGRDDANGTRDKTTGAGEAAGAGRQELPAVEVDARADDFIRQFREQLRLQRLDSILRYKDTLRRTGTV